MLETRHIKDLKLPGTWEVRQLNWGQLSDILAAAADLDGMAVQNRLMAAAIHHDGKPVGEQELRNLPGAVVMKLMPVVQELNPIGVDDPGEA